MNDKINNLILGVSNTALKYWLRRNDYKHSASNVDALVTVIGKSVDEGKLSYEQLQEGVREIEEHGGKRVYLKQMSSQELIRNYKTFEAHMADLKIPISETIGKIRKSSGGAKLDYAVWSGDEIRIRFSELHTHITPSKRKRKFKDQFVTKINTFSAESHTGFVKIFLDPPGDDHGHLDSRGNPTDSAYVEFYMRKAEDIFGTLEEYDLSTQTIKLLSVRPIIYELLTHSGRTEDNLQFIQRSRSDLRQSAHYKDANIVLPELVRGSWLKSQSQDQLERDLYMPIYPTEGKITFKADCLKQEVDYAISRIRQL